MTTKTLNIKDLARWAAMTLLLALVTSTAAGYEIDKAKNYHGSFKVSGALGPFDGNRTPTIHFVVKKRRTPGVYYQDWNYTDFGEFDIVLGWNYRFELVKEAAEGTYEIWAMYGDYVIFNTQRTVRPYQYFVTFHTDHGTAPTDLPVPDELTKALPVISCAGYTFVSWNTSSDGSGTNLLNVTNQSLDVYARWLPGSGTAEDPWRITSLQDWNVFRVLCNSNVSAVSLSENSHVRLDTDLTVTETLNSNEVFRGEFDGNGHTITINAGSSSSIGLFSTAQDCYIHNLKVEGTVANSNAKTSYMGGLAGRIVTSKGYLGDNGNGRSMVENCTVSVDLVSNTTSANCTVGGFIGCQENSNSCGITFTNCEFNGSMPSSGNSTAGFVGASADNLQFQDCIFAPRLMVQTPAYTFSNSYASANGIYYSEPGTTVQGEQVCTYLPSLGVYRVLKTAFANRYYQLQSSVSIDGLAASYAYTGSPITVTFTLSKDNAPLASNAYTAIVRNAAGETMASAQDLGIYSLEVTIPGEGTYAHVFYVTAPLTQTDGVYQINNLADWTRLADDVASGNTYSGATIRLNTDITTETMVGTESSKFSGTFDGNGHTLTYNYTSYKTVYDATENFRAPFRYISGATISNLTVAGSTISTGRQMGGLVAYASGNNHITNCTVSASLTSYLGGDASNGGFIAHVQDGSTSFSSCVFNGYLISGPSCRCNGGFVGWSGGALSFNNCLFNPVAVEMPSDGESESSTFARSNNVTFTDTYYTTAFGAVQGAHACMSLQNCIGEKKTMTNGSEIYVIHGTAIDGLAETYPYNGGEAVAISGCSVSHNGQTLDPSKYTVTIRNSAGEVVDAPIAAGQYTLTAAGKNDDGYYGSLSQMFTVVTTLATDENGYYLVSDANEWATLDYVVKNNPSFTGSKVKLTNDLSVTTKIGDGSHPFSSTFDGDGHTLTVNLSGGGTVAPFPFVSNATFINLHVAGSVSSTAPETWTGGLVGEVLGNVEITACRSSVNVTGTGQSMAGGFVATGGWAENRSISMRNCLFDGTLSGDLNFASGFVGDYYTTWSSSTLALINCLMNGTVDTSQGWITEVGPFYCYAFSPTLDYYTITNCYHKFESLPACKTFYSDQGFYTTSSGTELRDELGGGWTLDGDDVVPAMAQLNTRCITVTPDIEHGTVECMASNVPGQSVTVIVIPDDGYETTSVSYNDGTDHNISADEHGLYRFTMPNADVTVSATFSLSPNAVGYVAYNTETKQYENRLHTSPTVVTDESTGENDGIIWGTVGNESWYIVNSNITISKRIYVNGTVNLILADGKSLIAQTGITVSDGDKLYIYGQEAGTGALTATGAELGNGREAAAIGSEGQGPIVGEIAIHGGVINATGWAWTAAIGGGVNNGGGTIAIYGGTIHAVTDAEHSGEAKAIGNGSGGGDSSKTIADGLRVYVGNSNTPVISSNRVSSLSNKIVTVEPCQNHDWNNNFCTYCGLQHHFTVTYDGNGASGDVPAEEEFVIGGDMTCTVPDNTSELTGYAFIGWNTEADGTGIAYNPGTTFTVTEMTTLYAQWNIITYQIDYDLDGGTLLEGQSNPVTYTIESDDITLVNPTREGYEFLGWTGTDLGDATKDVTIYYGSMGNRTYTATWLGLPPEVSLVENSLTPNGATVKWTGSSESYTLQYGKGGPVVLSEGFERGSLPEGWTISEGSDWAVGSGTGHEDYADAATGNYNATCYVDDYDDDNYLITPVLDLSGVTSASLTFNYRNIEGHSSNELTVYYRVGSGEWNDLYSNSDEVSDWTLVTIPLEGLAANYQIGFRCECRYGNGMGIDDVQVLTEDTNFAWTTVDNAHSPYTLENLELETKYSVRVIGVTEGQADKMSKFLSITTLERYPKPFGFDIVENTLTAHSATVSWKGFSDSYNIRLGEDRSIVNADFETGDLSQAEFITTTSCPWTVAQGGHDGTYCAKSATGHDDETSALELKVTLPTDLTLTFSAKVSSESYYDLAYFSIDGDNMIDGISGNGNWKAYSYPLTAGSHTLRWYYEKDGSDSANDDCFYVDDIRIANGMTVLGTYTSATTNYNFTDLASEKTYLVQVQGVSENVTTDWSEPYAFTTANSCPKPTDLDTGIHDAHSVELSWTENGTATQWQICVNGDMSNLMTVSTNPYTLSGLSGDTEYTVKVRAYNNANEQSRWSNEVTFTTDIACFAPSDLTIGAISSRSVELSWTENGSSNKWVIEYSTDDEFTDAQSVEVTGTPSHTLTALTSGYAYYVRVRAINSDNELSRWSEYECFDAKQVIGDGGSDTNDNLPLNTDRKYSMSQQIYTTSELGEAGFIESIDFYADCYATRNIDVYMVSTSKSSFDSGTGWVPVTASDLVFSGEVKFNNSGWETITLDRYFEYDGTHNIVLVVDDNTGSDTWNYYHAFRVFDATKQAIYVNGSSDCDPLNPSSGTVLDVKNQIRLAISVSPKPTDVAVTDIAATSATISWNGEGGNYNVKYREATVASSWLSDALFFENFESGFGSWTRYAEGYSGSSTDWQQINPLNDKQTFQYISAYSRNYVAMSRSNVGTAVDNWLVSPQMTLGDVLKFHAHDDGTHHEHFEVYVSTKTKAISDFEKVADPSIDNASWNEITVDLSAYAGQEGYIAIRHNDTGKNFLFIDGFGVYKTIYEYTYGTETTLTCTTNSCELTGLSAGTIYEVQVQADGGAEGTSQWSSPIMFTTSFDLILANAADNSDAIRMASANGGEFTVTLADRTLYRDGDWNTLVLPFNLGDADAEAGHHYDGTPLEGATVMTLESTEFEDGLLTMTFADATSIEAGKPYIVKWTTTGEDLVNPTFHGVAVSDATENVSTDYADFIGTYSTTLIYEEGTEKHNLYLGSGNNLYYPSREGYSLKACRAYFQLKGITAGDPTSPTSARAFVLNFGEDEEQTGIRTITADDRTSSPSRTGIYTLDGRKLGTASDASDSEKLKALQPGLYIVNGKKTFIK